jgi:hypothetical protein
MTKNEDQIDKDMFTLEDLVGSIRERSKNCDPNILYPLGQYQTVVDRLFTKYEDISKDPKYKTRFNLLVKSFETYRGEFTSECICMKR